MKKGLTPSKELEERNKLLFDAKRIKLKHRCKTLAEVSKIYSGLTGKGRYYLRHAIARNGDTSEVMSYSSSSLQLSVSKALFRILHELKRGFTHA